MDKINSYLSSEKGISLFNKLYSGSGERRSFEAERYREVCGVFVKEFGSDDYTLFNTPGRTELGGNHTDHNNGRVLAGSINLDVIAAARPNGTNRILVHDLKYKEILKLDIGTLDPLSAEKDRPEALFRGVAAAFVKNGYSAGGFDAVLHSNVMSGSGLSSSAALEILIGSIYNRFYNSDAVSVIELALAGQYAENAYFGKPCGLMDQLACASGGIVGMDFLNPESPGITRLPGTFKEWGYTLAVVETGGSHADLTPEYAAIPEEMGKIAAYFNQKTCRGLTAPQLYDNSAELRELYGDRALLRVLHFINENRRVKEQMDALGRGEMREFLDHANKSGSSSWRLLQNISPAGAVKKQEMAIILAVSEDFIRGIGDGAVRVHGGGFAGTILAIIPSDHAGEYFSYISRISGSRSARILDIREEGSIVVC